MAAALDQQALVHGGAHGVAEIDAGDRAAGAGAAVAEHGDGEGRAAEALLQPRGDQTDHARMPAVLGSDHHRAALLQPERGERFGFGLGKRRLLDGPALGVQAIELERDLHGLGRVVGEQEARAKRGVADPAAGVDARP